MVTQFKLIPYFIKTNILTNFQVNWEKNMWPLEHPQGISLLWPTDLVYDPKWPKFKLVLDFMKKNILTIFQVNWGRNVASRECPQGKCWKCFMANRHWTTTKAHLEHVLLRWAKYRYHLTMFNGIHSSVCYFDNFIQGHKGSLQWSQLYQQFNSFGIVFL